MHGRCVMQIAYQLLPVTPVDPRSFGGLSLSQAERPGILAEEPLGGQDSLRVEERDPERHLALPQLGCCLVLYREIEQRRFLK